MQSGSCEIKTKDTITTTENLINEQTGINGIMSDVQLTIKEPAHDILMQSHSVKITLIK